MADTIIIDTAAKINLGLDVTGILGNGYHSIRSVFQTVGIYDRIIIEDTPNKPLKITCTVPDRTAVPEDIPCDERNIVYKAAKNFYECIGADYGFHGCCRIHIVKRIPSQAGMGGGSADAAAVIYGLRELYNSQVFDGVPTDISGENMPEAALKTGADVPFLLTGGTALVEGIGEKITPINDYSGRILVIAKGRQGVSTAEAYAKIDALVSPAHPDIDALVNSINNSPDNAYKYFGNLFEEAIQLGEVRDIISNMEKNGALKACMTGSGSAVFGIFNNESEAEDCAEKLRFSGYFAKTCMTVPDSFKTMII